MSLPPTKAQIDTALSTPALANTLIDDLRRMATQPLVFWPEMFGAPEIAHTALPSFDPTTTAVADTSALQACMARLKTYGGTLLLGRPYGLNAALTLEVTKESVLDGQRIQGLGGAYNCGLQMTANGFDALTIKGLVAGGSGKAPAHVSMQDFFIKGGSSTGKGIMAQNAASASGDTNVSNAEFARLLIYTGSDGIHLGENFQTILRLVKSSSHRGHSFNLNGSNATQLYGCYASSPGPCKAGFRIFADAPVSLYSCTGLDENDSHWAIFGGMAPVAGTARSGGSTTIARIAAGDTAPTGFYDGMEFKIGSARYVIGRHEKNNATHGNCLFLSPDTPLGSPLSGGESYEIADGESRWGNNGTALGKDARIDLIGCNVESWARTGIKFCRRGLATMQNMMFYHPTEVNEDYDCCIYINHGSDDKIHTSKLLSSRFDLFGDRLYPADIIQGLGSRPCLMGERLAASFRSIYSMEAGASLRMLHTDPIDGIQLPTGFATSNPGPGQLWNDGGTLKVGT